MAGETSNKAQTLVFMDLETSGLKRNGVNPEITELFMVAVGRGEFSSDSTDKVQNSVRLAFKTERPIPEIVSRITGLNANNLRDQETFNVQTIELLNLFLSRLEKPICILAHNGKRFDFALLKAEVNRFQRELIPDLLCADTLEGFKQIDKERLDGISTGLAQLSTNNSPKEKTSYKLEEIYKRMFPTGNLNAHRAESDVKMMYEIALQDKSEFLNWVDKYSTEFSKIRLM